MPELSQLIENCLISFGHGPFDSLKAFVQSGEYRDEDFNMKTYAKVFNLIEFLVNTRYSSQTDLEIVHGLRNLCISVLSCDEFKVDEAVDVFDESLARKVVYRANPSKLVESDSEDECNFIEHVLRKLYEKLPSRRCVIRKEIGRFLLEYVQISTRTSHLTPILNVLNDVIQGMCSVDHSLFTDILLPLHKPNGWSFWDRQTAILAEYHKPLVQCCYSLVEKDRTLATTLVDSLLTQSFPPVNQCNTAKELLLLFEISKFLDLVDLDEIMGKLMMRILDSINSENAQIVQSALVFWKSPPSKFPRNLRPYLAQYMDSLLFALFRGTGEPHWNPTVNKMTLLVLKCLESSDSELFEKAANRVIPITNFSKKDPLNSNSNPGIGVPPSLAASVGATDQPPLGITGIAPWLGEPHLSQKLREGCKSETCKIQGYKAIMCYIQALEPSAQTVCSEKPWQAALSADSPTLLPELKFHNLVFGKDLGIGAFSTVRYARVVKQKSSLSQWEEVAVKVISYDTIRKENYGENILREISCLRRLSHPSIARLISSFRWRDGIYLVLEYGACGDLHTYVRRNGPLSENSAKIVVGEVGTALAAVHEAGFIYGDLKPENIVITATKHVKLADFGACRPFSAEAKQMLVDARNELTNMRSGDWKCDDASCNVVIELSVENILNPKTYEGTSAYLSPEIVASQGMGPSVLSDAYALGMTTYFLLKGRLPQWTGEKSESNHFDSTSLMEQDSLLSELSEYGKKFILSLMESDPDTRWSVQDTLSSEWLSELQPVRRLFLKDHSDHLSGAEGGAVLSASESAWEKRQLSKIWTAQPVDYALGSKMNVSAPHSTLRVIEETDIERGSPFI